MEVDALQLARSDNYPHANKNCGYAPDIIFGERSLGLLYFSLEGIG